MAQNLDLQFLGKAFEDEIPKDKKYLLNYFATDLQQAFLKYFLAFNTYENFVDHTGLACQMRWLDNLYTRLKNLEMAHKKAKSAMDMTALAQIEAGDFKFTEITSE